MKVYLDEDLEEVNKSMELIAIQFAEMIIHARKGKFDQKNKQIQTMNSALTNLRELHLKLDDESMKVRGTMF